MANQYKSFLGGLLGGLENIGHAIAYKNPMDDIKKEYSDATDYLKQSYKYIMEQQNAILKGEENKAYNQSLIQNETPATESPTEQPQIPTQSPRRMPIIPVAPSKEDVLMNLNSKYLELFSPEAQPYKSALDNMYKELFNNARETAILEGHNGSKYLIDKNTGTILNTIIGEKEKERESKIAFGEESYIAEDGKYYKAYPVYSNGKITGTEKVEISEDDYNKALGLGRYAPKSYGGRGGKVSVPKFSEENRKLTEYLTKIGKANALNLSKETIEGEEANTLKETLANSYGWSEEKINEMADKLWGGEDVLALKTELEGEIEDVRDKISSIEKTYADLNIDEAIKQLMVLSNINKTGMVDNTSIMDSIENEIWNTLGEVYNDIHPDIIEGLYKYVGDKINQARWGK